MSTYPHLAHGDHFNREAAAKVFDLVMKMDDDTAEVFVEHVAYNLLHDDLQRNRRTVDRHIRDVSKRLINNTAAAVRKGLLPREAFEAVSKAFGDDEYNRDKSGRFARTESRVRTNRVQKPNRLPGPKGEKRWERTQGIPSAKALAGASANERTSRPLSPQERAAYQQQYLQLVDIIDDYTNRGVRNPEMVLEDKRTGRRSTRPAAPNGNIGEGWNASTHNLVAVRGEDTERGASRAAFDVVSALGSNNAAQGASTAVRGVEQGGKTFADEWSAPGKVGTNDRTYQRIKAGSQLLGQVSSSPKVQAAAKLGEFVGEYGPQAERVIGPTARKTAYRYRGVERKPDAELENARAQQLKRMMVPEGDLSVHQIAARRAAGTTGLSPEQKQMATVNAAIPYLYKRLPSAKLSEIQRQSGKLPPSEGIIIDRNGEIVTQAVGYMEDHYLPFNLKNLKRLRGGEYVRTRSSGGLTTEDIYTGLVSGARQVTVVSNSGVFTIDFADDFRGVRRYNDKAAGMVERYAKTLDAIQSKTIERQPLDPAVKAEIRDRVTNEMKIWGASPQEIEDRVKQEVDAYRAFPTPTKKELADLEAKVASAKPKDDAERKRIYNELYDALMESKADRHYQLDGEGYAAALEALREQYPYYIERVTYEHRRGSMSETGERGGVNERSGLFRSGSDRGYVRPNYNRPKDVNEGYFDPEIQGTGPDGKTGKISAARTNHQNYTRQRREEPKAAEAEGQSENTPKQPKNQRVQEARQKLSVEKEQQAIFEEAANTLGNVEGANNLRELANNPPEDWAAWLAGPKREGVLADLRTINAQLNKPGNEHRDLGQTAEALLRRYDRSATAVGGKEWSPTASIGEKSKVPFKFPEVERMTPQQAGEAAKALEAQHPFLADSDDEDLAEISSVTGKFVRTLRSDGDATQIVRATTAMGTQLGFNDDQIDKMLNVVEGGDATQIAAMADRYEKTIKNIEMYRALQAKLNTGVTITSSSSSVTAPKHRDVSVLRGIEDELKEEQSTRQLAVRFRMLADAIEEERDGEAHRIASELAEVSPGDRMVLSEYWDEFED